MPHKNLFPRPKRKVKKYLSPKEKLAAAETMRKTEQRMGGGVSTSRFIGGLIQQHNEKFPLRKKHKKKKR